MMEQYFDAFFYYANWGTHWFMLRLPKKPSMSRPVKQYAADDHLDIWTKGDFVMLDFAPRTNRAIGTGTKSEGGLASLIPLRADLLNGDFRALYLGWLAAAQDGILDADDVEPPAPPGLQRLSASLKSLAEFLRIDDKLLKAAATAGPAEVAVQTTKKELARWIAKLPAAEKNKILLQLAEGNDPHLSMHLLQTFPQIPWKATVAGSSKGTDGGGRSANCWPRQDWAKQPKTPRVRTYLGRRVPRLACPIVFSTLLETSPPWHPACRLVYFLPAGDSSFEKGPHMQCSKNPGGRDGHGELRQILNDRFGFAQFKPGQQEVIEHLLAGRSAAAVFPTGGGKSLCYQLPALLLPG